MAQGWGERLRREIFALEKSRRPTDPPSVSFAGRTWACRTEVPVGLLRQVLQVAESWDRMKPRRRQERSVELHLAFLQAAVVDWPEMFALVGESRDRLEELFGVVPGLSEHYQELDEDDAQRGGAS